jgi:chemotaxis signal transduction protein
MKPTGRHQKTIQVPQLTLLEFMACHKKWAIPALDIVRIIESQPIDEIPQENLALSGFVEYENEKIPFLSLGMFCENEKETKGPLIIYEHKDGRLALGLSQVFTLKKIPEDLIKPLPPIFEEGPYKKALTGCYFDEEDIVPIVDLKNLEF